MSLDIWGKISTATCTCPNCDTEFTQFEKVFEFNITHNLSKMAEEAGCGILWDWDITGMKAHEIINAVDTAIVNMKREPTRFDAFNAPNGWGTRIEFIPWLEKLLDKLREFPQAVLGISK